MAGLQLGIEHDHKPVIVILQDGFAALYTQFGDFSLAIQFAAAAEKPGETLSPEFYPPERCFRESYLAGLKGSIEGIVNLIRFRFSQKFSGDCRPKNRVSPVLNRAVSGKN